MMTQKDSLTMRLRTLPKHVVLAAIRQWAVTAVHRREKIEDALVGEGFERVGVADGRSATDDGRQVYHVAGRAYALRPDVHAERLAAALDAAKKRQPEPETKSVVGTESLSAMACPKCGDSLQHTAVCPNCAAGKLGYRHRYTCVCGGVDLISREAL